MYLIVEASKHSGPFASFIEVPTESLISQHGAEVAAVVIRASWCHIHSVTQSFLLATVLN